MSASARTKLRVPVFSYDSAIERFAKRIAISREKYWRIVFNKIKGVRHGPDRDKRRGWVADCSALCRSSGDTNGGIRRRSGNSMFRSKKISPNPSSRASGLIHRILEDLRIRSEKKGFIQPLIVLRARTDISRSLLANALAGVRKWHSMHQLGDHCREFPT